MKKKIFFSRFIRAALSVGDISLLWI